MQRILFELAGKDTSQRFSPHCWKSHLALNHKGIHFDSQPVQYHQYSEKLNFTDYSLLPVLKDGEKVITDSWDIACYLEEHYPGEPLFNNESEKQAAKSMNQYCDTTLAKLIRPLVLMDIFQLIADEDKAYFRESREKKLDMTLEQFSANASESLIQLKKELSNIEKTLERQPFLGGEAPRYTDICLLSMFMWVACVNDTPFLKDNNHLKKWYQCMLKKYPDAEQAVNHSIKI